MSTMHGWSTADPSSIAVWEHLPSGLRCQLVLEDPDGHMLVPTRWEPLEEILPDGGGHSLAHLRLEVGEAEVEVECGGEGDIGACRIANVIGDHFSAHWEISGSLEGWQVRREPYTIAFAPAATALPEDIPAFLHEQHEVTLRTAPHGEWKLAQPLAAMEAAIAANTVTVPGSDEVLTLSRHTLQTEGVWRLPNWSTFLTALGVAYMDPPLAVAEMKTALRLLTVDGRLAADWTPAGVQSELSNPPVAAYCIWKLYQLTGDRSLLSEAYAPLLRWHDWWWNARDGNQNHLLNWISAEETGMPEHPIYAGAPTDPHSGVLRMDDVGLCSLWALDAFALMRMALLLNDLDQATHLESEINSLAMRMNLTLWDHTTNAYRSRDWDGYPTDRSSATVFLALTGGIPTKGKASTLVDRRLNADFDTPFLIPTVGKDDPAFREQLPWRGRVSPLLNFLICEGLRQFGMDDIAETISMSGLEMLEKNWSDHHHLYASYNALTGMGNDITQDALAPGGILLSVLGIAMLIDAEAWNGLRFGNLRGVDMAISGFPLLGDRYDITSGPWGLSVSRNDALWFDLDRPAILRNLATTEREISCSIKLPGGGPLRLRFHGFNTGQRIAVKINGNASFCTADNDGIVVCIINIEPQRGGYGIWHRAA